MNLKTKQLLIATTLVFLTTLAVADVVPSRGDKDGYTWYYPCHNIDDVTGILIVNKNSIFINGALDKAHHKNGYTGCDLIIIVDAEHPEGWDYTNLDFQKMWDDLERFLSNHNIPVLLESITDAETGDILHNFPPEVTVENIPDDVREAIYDTGYNDAYYTGFNKGHSSGNKYGYDSGFNDGYLIGFDNGYEQGYVPDY